MSNINTDFTKQKLEAQIQKANSVTGKSDTDLIRSVDSLIDGYGKGSGITVISQTKTVIPTKETQEVTPTGDATHLHKVIVNPIPDEYVIPSGEVSLTTNGTHNVSGKKTAKVNVPIPQLEGTAIPVGEPVERIYFNTNLSIEETNAYLSQLNYVQTPLNEMPLNVLYASSDGGELFALIAFEAGEEGYYISLLRSSISVSPFSSTWVFRGNAYGWNVILENNSGYYDIVGSISSASEYEGYSPLTNFQGLPIGLENEKIKNVMSITPFVAEGIIPVGTLEITENGTYPVGDKESVNVNVLSAECQERHIHEVFNFSEYLNHEGAYQQILPMESAVMLDGDGILLSWLFDSIPVEYHYSATKPKEDILVSDFEHLYLYYLEEGNDLYAYGDLQNEGENGWFTLGEILYALGIISEVFSLKGVSYEFGTPIPTENGYYLYYTFGDIDVCKNGFHTYYIRRPVDQLAITENGSYDVTRMKLVHVNIRVPEIPVWDGSLTMVISFTINGTTYYSPEGWTWGEWVADTNYNTGGYYLEGNSSTGAVMKNSSTDVRLGNVMQYGNGEITANANYVLGNAGSSGGGL